MFSILILLAVCSGCASWKYSDDTVNRAMNYRTPENGEPTVMHGSGVLSSYSNSGNPPAPQNPQTPQ
jgi:hypothetical protein